MKRFVQAGLFGLSALIAPALHAQEGMSIEAMLAAQAKLGYQLLSGLNEAAGEGVPTTLMASPASLAGALSAMDLGADPAMHGAIAKTLGFALKDADAAMDALREVAMTLSEAEPGEGPLSFANALFFAPMIKLSPVMSDELSGADVDAYTVDLGSDEGVKQINEWVAQRTADLIPTLLDKPLPSAVMVALNALYFKDSWLTEFSPADTVPGPFYVSGGTIEVPMMHLNETPLWVREDDKFIAVTLPFENQKYYLTVVTTKDAPATLAGLEPAVEWLSGHDFEEVPANLTLPKFETDTSASILPIVEALGLKAGYTGQAFAKFGVMQQITAIIQKAVFKVDESGAEAAAATAVIVDRSLGKKDKPEIVDVVIDKPFLFSLSDEENGLVLLTGYVANPGGADAVVTTKVPDSEAPTPATRKTVEEPAKPEEPAKADEPAKGDAPVETTEEAKPAAPTEATRGTAPSLPSSGAAQQQSN